MRRGIIFLVLTILESGIVFSQTTAKDSSEIKQVLADGHFGFDQPEYIILFEAIPSKRLDCNYPLTTMIFELAVTEDYFNSVSKNQEISSWFRTDEGTVLVGSFPPSNVDKNNRWKLMIRDKKITSKNN